MKTLEIIIPVFNEEEVLTELFLRLEKSLAPELLQAAGVSGCRYLFVDDGSTDSTAALITARIQDGMAAKLLRFSRNFGHQNAVSAGLTHSTGDLVAVIDADLQDPPELLPGMIQALNEGFDVVYGERAKRDAKWYMRICYWAFYRLLRLISDVPVPVDAGDFCVMERRVVDAICNLPERLRFVRGLRSWVGFKQLAFPYSRPNRAAGESKYNLKSLYRLATDGVASLSIRPLRITQAVLFFSLFITLFFLTIGLALFFSVNQQTEYGWWFLLTYLLIGFTSSLQIFCLYIIGAYVGRAYLEVKERPGFVIMEIINRD